MIELEIQGLAASREGLLIEMSRCMLAIGFTVRRQRLVHDRHGILLTMVVHGSTHKRRALEKSLETCERLISYNIALLVDGEPKPHFAASRPPSNYLPAALLDSSVTAPPSVPARAVQTANPAATYTTPAAVQTLQSEAELEFIAARARTPLPAPVTPVAITPFVEMVPLGPNVAAVDKALRSLEYDYPDLLPNLLTLQAVLPEAARDASLALAGQRTGGWVFAREYAADTGLDLLAAISRIGVPALRALVDVDQQNTQLHVRNSPLCTAHDHSGCRFFCGFLEGLLGPAIAPQSVSIFPVCCRSYGANECVLAISA